MARALLVRQKLAKYRDESFDAVAHRLRAARFVAGVSKVEISRSGLFPPALDHIEAAEAGRVMPDYILLDYYRRKLGLRDAFFEQGEVDHVPWAIEDRLFDALKSTAGN